jgi:hypothetical protein
MVGAFYGFEWWCPLLNPCGNLILNARVVRGVDFER